MEENIRLSLIYDIYKLKVLIGEINWLFFE